MTKTQEKKQRKRLRTQVMTTYTYCKIQGSGKNQNSCRPFGGGRDFTRSILLQPSMSLTNKCIKNITKLNGTYKFNGN